MPQPTHHECRCGARVAAGTLYCPKCGSAAAGWFWRNRATLFWCLFAANSMLMLGVGVWLGRYVEAEGRGPTRYERVFESEGVSAPPRAVVSTAPIQRSTEPRTVFDELIEQQQRAVPPPPPGFVLETLAGTNHPSNWRGLLGAVAGSKPVDGDLVMAYIGPPDRIEEKREYSPKVAEYRVWHYAGGGIVEFNPAGKARKVTQPGT